MASDILMPTFWMHTKRAETQGAKPPLFTFQNLPDVFFCEIQHPAQASLLANSSERG